MSPSGEAIKPVLLLFLVLAALVPRPAGAADLCVVRVEDTAAAGSIEAEQPHRYLWNTYTFPTSPLFVLKPQRRGIWTLSDDRRFVRITEGTPPRDPDFPTGSPLDDLAVEQHSGRVLGLGMGNRRGPWALAPGGARFIAHRPEQWPELGFLRTRATAYVPAWRATVFGGTKGLFLARDDDPLAPVPGPDGRLLGDVNGAVAVPGRGVAIFGTASGQTGLVVGEHGPERTRWLSPHQGTAQQGPGYVTRVLPLTRPGTFLVRSQGRGHILSHVLWLPPDAEASGEAAVEEVERELPDPPFAHHRQAAPGTGEYLVYVPVTQRERLPSRAGLFRLDGTRFVPVPGGEAAALGRDARLFAVPSRGLVVASAHDGRLFAYRDGALAPVEGGNEAGPYNTVRDLPLVGRVLVHSPRGAFELTRDLRLVPVPAPVASLRIVAVAEMPPSGVAAVIAEEGVFALGPEGGLAPVPGGEAAWSRVANHVFLPSRNELLFTGHKGLFLLVDRRLSGPDACAPPP